VAQLPDWHHVARADLLANPGAGKKPGQRRIHGGPEAVAHRHMALRGQAPHQLIGRVRYCAGSHFLMALTSIPLITCAAQDSLANPGFGSAEV